MEYSVQNLTEVTDCDSLLTWAQNEKSDLEYKELTDSRLINKSSTTSVDIAATLQGVLAELSAVEMMLATLPDGPSRADALKRKKKLEYQQFLLEDRKASYGFVALLQKESELQRIRKEMESVDLFIRAINGRRDELLAS